ncbi:serine hydrolase domain-containing protein [Marininema halotolerans]|uniref:CubicO group peptidase, beta-lactamase class C family n=1 Tax=Marininema halotolerans TaxID=1155944 RepID=A0A1I6RXN2_9BACL|nr:serine hydrolase [Marininema halotolerans]SFS69454.1 CubicO group peptidase, beta-lactamase class C family [Marininema halotolerans]
MTLGLSLVFPSTLWAKQSNSLVENKYPVDKVGKERIPTKRSWSPWDHPAPLLSTLHEGKAREVGMVKQSLDAIDPYMDREVERGIIPGAVVFVARSGVVVKEKAYGDAVKYTEDAEPLDQPIKMKKDTIFDLASISKIYTATLVLKLYEQGSLRLDDPVATYLPDFAQNGKEKVTIRQLLTHTSGFEAGIPLWKYEGSRKDRIQRVMQHPLQNQPGTTYLYSDLNMITLGALVEKVTKKRLDVVLAELITGPLGLKDTSYNPSPNLKNRIAATEFQPLLNRGMIWGEVHDENAWALDGVAGHAGIFSTAQDVAVFLHMLLNHGKYGNVRILKPKTVAIMEKNQNIDFPGHDHGLGWELNQPWYMDGLSGTDSMGHTGFTGTSIVVSRSNALLAITLTNRVHPTRQTPSINPLRRQVSRMIADAIPVQKPGRSTSWFSSYGDELNRILQSEELPKGKNRTLSFDTWYRIDPSGDFGIVEGSVDGERWISLSSSYSGDSEGWGRQRLTLPEDIRYVRFRYHTDESGNGRGWYVKQPIIQGSGNIVPCTLMGDDWEQGHW